MYVCIYINPKGSNTDIVVKSLSENKAFFVYNLRMSSTLLEAPIPKEDVIML